MTEQPNAGWYPPPGAPGQQQLHGEQPVPGQMPGPMPGQSVDAYGRPYGFDAQGRPLSDKRQLTAGLLQLLLGSFGIGRFYLGYTTIGVLQIVITVVTVGTAGWIWPLIDGIMILTGNVRDSQGRTLRP
jgi:TM2 domain-containing membrane protein YozV